MLEINRMSDFTIPKGKNTPAVMYSHTDGVLSVGGRSYPEDARSFYDKLAAKLGQLKLPKNLCFDLGFDYINSSSIACILDLIKEQQSRYPDTHFSIKISCSKSDDDMIDMGENYSSLTGIAVDFAFK